MERKSFPQVEKDLLAMREITYRDFMSRLLPSVEKSRLLGVRVPRLRAYAKTLSKNGKSQDFMRALPHKYHEEDLLHALLINALPLEAAQSELTLFLPFVDNWGVCDSLRPRAFKDNLSALLPTLDRYLQSEHTYTVRFAIEMLMLHGLDRDFSPAHFLRVYRSPEADYYLAMMKAWYFATALAARYKETLAFLKAQPLSPTVLRMTLGKVRDSRRLTASQKAAFFKLFDKYS